MGVCLLAWGSRGDVQPLVALGRGLRTAGFDVTVAAAPSFTSMITAADLAADPFPDQSATLQTPHGRRWRNGSIRSGREQLRLWRAVLKDLTPGIADHVAGLVGRHDAFVSGVITFTAMLSAAPAIGKHHVTTSLTPSSPTRSGPATVFAPRPDTDSVLNLAAGAAGQLGASPMMRPLASAVENRLGIRRQSLHDAARGSRRTPTLVGVSPHVVPRPRDVPARVTMTGYWTEPLAPDYAPPADLEAFLRAGPDPVYLGFGSMPAARPDALFDLLATAVRRAGRRGLIYGDWDGRLPDYSSDDVLAVDAVPHEWLFPRTAAVVHHGGAGTTAAAVRAGVPQVVVAHFGDQPYWGRRVAQLGIGPAPIPRRELDVDRLAAAIVRLTGDETLRVRADVLGARVRAEDGVAVAVEAAEDLLRS